MKPEVYAHVAEEMRQADRGDRADNASRQAEQQRFDEDQAHHPVLAPADCPQGADFLDPLEHGHDHRVQHADRADEQGDCRGGPGHGTAEFDRPDVLDEIVRRDGGDPGLERFDLSGELLNAA